MYGQERLLCWDEVKSGQKRSYIRKTSQKVPKSVLYPEWGPRRGSYIRNEGPGEGLMSGWGQERVKELSGWDMRGPKVLYPDEGRRELKNVRMRHERAKKSYIQIRAGEDQRMLGWDMRGPKSLITGWERERVKECQDETWDGLKFFYPDGGARELKNVRMRHERAKKSYIRMRAGES